MATDDAEHVAEPSNGSSHVMQMTSQLPLCVQQLNCDDIDDVNDSVFRIGIGNYVVVNFLR